MYKPSLPHHYRLADSPLRVHAAEVGDDGVQDLPGSLHQMEAVLGVDQEQPCGSVSLVTLPTGLEQALVVPCGGQVLRV